MSFDFEFSLGHLLTASAVLVSAMALFYSWRKDRALREKTYADDIRKSAGLVLAKIERWRQLNLSFYDSVDELITATDRLLVDSRDKDATRDFLWEKLVSARASIKARVIDERIELVFADLYGYDPAVHDLFKEALLRLRIIETNAFEAVRNLTQLKIYETDSINGTYQSTSLGNVLRMTVGRIECDFFNQATKVIEPFNSEILRLVRSSDRKIVRKNVSIGSPSAILPDVQSSILRVEESLKESSNQAIQSEKSAPVTSSEECLPTLSFVSRDIFKPPIGHFRITQPLDAQTVVGIGRNSESFALMTSRSPGVFADTFLRRFFATTSFLNSETGVKLFQKSVESDLLQLDYRQRSTDSLKLNDEFFTQRFTDFAKLWLPLAVIHQILSINELLECLSKMTSEAIQIIILSAILSDKTPRKVTVKDMATAAQLSNHDLFCNMKSEDENLCFLPADGFKASEVVFSIPKDSIFFSISSD